MLMVEPNPLLEGNLKQLQAKNLEIARYFVAFCRENQIQVFLCGGACLGAIRHQGFIPWDDDIDLFMPAPDFEKLKRVWAQKADTKRYSLCIESRHYNDHHLTPTIRDNNTTFITRETCETDTNQGVALEIAVLHACPKSRLVEKMQILCAAGAALFKAQRLPNRQGKFLYWGAKILLSVFRGEGIRYFFWNTLERWSTRYDKDYDTAAYVKELGMFPYMNWRYPREWFEEMLWVPFEDTEMPVPKGCREYLTRRYGNYMELPPEEDRHPEHHLIFMDLENSYLKYRGIHYFTKGSR